MKYLLRFIWAILLFPFICYPIILIFFIIVTIIRIIWSFDIKESIELFADLILDKNNKLENPFKLSYSGSHYEFSHLQINERWEYKTLRDYILDKKTKIEE